MNKSNVDKNFWILGSILSIVLLPIVFVIGFALGVFYEGSMSLSQDNLSSWVTALATLSIAILTIILAKETWNLRNIQLQQIEQIRKDAIRPSINFELKSSSFSISYKDIYIVNNGTGSAHEIKFIIEGSNEKNNEIYNHLEKEFLKINIIKNGILSLGVNDSRSTHIFDFPSLHSKYGEDVLKTYISVTAYYKDIEGKEFKSKSEFDFSEYVGISKLGDEPLNTIAKSMKKIEDSMKNLNKGMSFKRFEVNTYNSKDREIENKEMKQHLEEQRKMIDTMNKKANN